MLPLKQWSVFRWIAWPSNHIFYHWNKFSMSIVNKNMTKNIFLECDMAAVLKLVNKKFSPRELLVLPMVLWSGGSTLHKITKKHLFCHKTWLHEKTSTRPLDYNTFNIVWKVYNVTLSNVSCWMNIRPLKKVSLDHLINP